MADLKCMCGKTLTDENVCPIIRGTPCRGAHEIVPPYHKRKKRPVLPWETQSTPAKAEEPLYPWTKPTGPFPWNG